MSEDARSVDASRTHEATLPSGLVLLRTRLFPLTPSHCQLDFPAPLAPRRTAALRPPRILRPLRDLVPPASSLASPPPRCPSALPPLRFFRSRRSIEEAHWLEVEEARVRFDVVEGRR